MWIINSVQFSSFAQLCQTHHDPKDHSTPGLPVHHQLPESTQLISIELVMSKQFVRKYVAKLRIIGEMTYLCRQNSYL